MVTQFCRRLIPCFLLVLALHVVIAVLVPATPVLAACPVDQQPCPAAPGGCISERDLCILEPLPFPGSPTFIPSGGKPMSAFFTYLNQGVWQWVFMIGVAIAVLNGVIGGLQIVMSNGDSGKVDAGKSRFLSSTIGLLMLLLSGVILEFINPVGFDAI